MNIIKISDLPPASALNGTEEIPVVQSGVTKRLDAGTFVSQVDATPVNGHDTIPISSDWAYDQQVRINTLYDYISFISPKIDTFKINDATAIVLETGDSLSNPLFTWALSGAEPYISVISGIGSVLAQTQYQDTGTYTTNQNWTLSIVSKNPINQDISATNTVSLTFKDKIYWGGLVTDSITNQDIFNLGNSAFESGLERTVLYDATGGKYLYYVYPAYLGQISLVLVNGLSFSDYTEWDMSFTNSHSVSKLYHIVRFDHLQHGTNIEVKWA